METEFAAVAPSPTAVVTCLHILERISPAANTPGKFVLISQSVTTNPCASSWISEGRNPDCGSYPMKINNPFTSSRELSPLTIFFRTRASAPLPPQDLSLRNSIPARCGRKRHVPCPDTPSHPGSLPGDESDRPCSQCAKGTGLLPVPRCRPPTTATI